MKRLLFGLITILLAFPAIAAEPQLRLDFPDLATNSIESVDVSLDGPMLRLASKFMSDEKDERQARAIIEKLDGIYVKHFEYDKPNAYPADAPSRVRTQLGAEWKPIVTVRSKTEENVEIYVIPNGDSIRGMVIIAAEPKEFTVVNLVGPITLDEIGALEGEFGIPQLPAGAKGKGAKQ